MPIPSNVEDMIQKFEKRNGKTAFTKIKRKALADQLRKRIKDPYLINQGNASLCGPAVFIYYLAKRRPKQYAQYIIDLYEKGEADIGRLKVKPGRDCKDFKPGAAQGIMQADWVALAGLRDSENAFFDYDHPNDQIPGITLPGDIAKWFTLADSPAVRKNTNIIFDKSLYTLLQAHKLYRHGTCVCLFVGQKVLQGKSGGRCPADHWVVLNSPIQFDGKPVDGLLRKGLKVNDDKSLLSKKIQFLLYTWGEEYRWVNKANPKLIVKEFLDYFYGYVSAL
jgi:hypothetical protein